MKRILLFALLLTTLRRSHAQIFTPPSTTVSATGSQTAQTANLGSTTILASAQAGVYRLSCNINETTAATTSSTLPYCILSCTDRATSANRDMYPPWSGIVATANITGFGQSYVLTCDAAAGTAITFRTTNYASSGATAMQYTAQYVLERISN